MFDICKVTDNRSLFGSSPQYCHKLRGHYSHTSNAASFQSGKNRLSFNCEEKKVSRAQRFLPLSLTRPLLHASGVWPLESERLSASVNIAGGGERRAKRLKLAPS